MPRLVQRLLPGRFSRGPVLAIVMACGLAAAPGDQPSGRPPALGAAAAIPPRLDVRPVLGFAINAHHISDLSLYLESVDAIAELGANALIVVTPMFQDRIDSSRIRYLPNRCPTDDQLVAILQRARDRGLHTTLLPIVLIEFPREKDWRGVIQPADPDAWWASYRRFIDRFLEISVTAEVDVFSVGSELNTTEADIARWQEIIDHVRPRFSGRLAYTANWDRYEAVSLWPLVDVIGISAYFELSREAPDAPVDRLARAWRVERGRIEQFARRQERPFVLMEVGYPSLPWAAAHPWNYVARDGTKADHEAQARCYRAFFAAWSDTVARPDSPALGFHCYLWDPYNDGEDTDTGYGVRGKPALRVIRNAFQKIRQATQRAD